MCSANFLWFWIEKMMECKKEQAKNANKQEKIIEGIENLENGWGFSSFTKIQNDKVRNFLMINACLYESWIKCRILAILWFEDPVLYDILVSCYGSLEHSKLRKRQKASRFRHSNKQPHRTVYGDGLFLLYSQALLGSGELFITKVNKGVKYMN